MKRGPRAWVLAVLVVGLLAAGCAQAPPPTPLEPMTGASPQPTPELAPAPATLAGVEPVPTPACLANDAEFLEDLTLPDGTEVLPGAVLNKRWLILNRGSCAWGPEYRLVQVGDSRIEAPRELALYPAVPGSQAVWQVAMTAPMEAGEYISRWQARTPDGLLFGDEVYVLIVVNPAPLTPTAIPTAARP